MALTIDLNNFINEFERSLTLDAGTDTITNKPDDVSGVFSFVVQRVYNYGVFQQTIIDSATGSVFTRTYTIDTETFSDWNNSSSNSFPVYPINDITASATVDSTIKDNLNTLNITGAVTLTVDDTSIVDVVAGTQINFLWQSDSGANTVTFATGGSQTIISESSQLDIRAVGCAVTLIYLGSNTWSLFGALA